MARTATKEDEPFYAVGFSMGGGTSHYVACHAADLFAAVAPAAFDLLQENVGDCKPPRPITLIVPRHLRPDQKLGTGMVRFLMST